MHETSRRFGAFAILEFMRPRPILGLTLTALLVSCVIARGDEFRLKDGTKISGTIVGFENDSFKVETSYGFALVRKDKIAEIIPSAPKKEPEAKSKSDPDPKPKPAAASKTNPDVFPAAVPASTALPSAAADAPATVNAAATGHPASAENPPAPPAKKDAPAVKEKAVAAAPPAPPAPPPPPPGPPPIRDEMRGNTYMNYTFGFQMYKPPSWDLIPEARKALPDAVAAMGTSNQTTLLVIGREQGKLSLEAHAAKTERALSEIYENYRVISARSTAIAGLPAIERRVRGTVDGHDWSVILVEFQRGTDIFTLLGMTWENSDLIQMQENVLSRAINSLSFNPATP